MAKISQLNIRPFPEDLRRKFKALCTLQGTTMKDEIIKFMTEELKREGMYDAK